MIVLYGGKLVIERRSLCHNWQATVKISNQGRTFIDLQTPDLKQAFIRAQYHFLALKQDKDYEEVEAEQASQTRCWSCFYWSAIENNCQFDFPEARQTAGRFASRCQLYSVDGKPGAFDQGEDPLWGGEMD